MKVNTVITLSNDDKYMILNEATYQDHRYILAMGVDDNKEIIQSMVAIFKEVLENDDIYVEKVEDSSLIIELTNLLKAQLK